MSILTSFTFSPADAALGPANGQGAAPVVGSTPAALPHRLTVAQVEAMIRSGILNEYDRCELIRGELIEKLTLGDRHMATLRRLNRWFNRIVGDRFLVSVQDAVKLRDSRPAPDFTLLLAVDDYYRSRTPEPADIRLLVEVADSTLALDRLVKLPLYAENGIAETWIVNLVDDWLEVYRQPQPGGVYAQWRVVRRGESIAPLALPHDSLPVSSILGPAAPAV
jgi:Uma2 family endonuclease